MTIKPRNRFRRMDYQVSILTALIVILSCFLVFLIAYRLTYDDMIFSLKERSLNIYQYLESQIPADSFSGLNTQADEADSLYQDTKQILETVKNITGVRYLYTAKRTEDGSFIYVVDGLPADSSDFRHVGDQIESEICPELDRALTGERILPDEIKATSWGYIFISYLPIRSGEQVVGVLGIEFNAEHQFKTYRLLMFGTPAVILAACLIAAAVAVRLFKRISNPNFRDLSNTDLLTGLKNRNAFETDLNNLKDCAGTLLFSIDLDNLKRINDTLGHPEGDVYIQTGSELIRLAADKKGVPYRTGGDEFAILLTGVGEETAKALWARLSALLQGQDGPANRRVSLSVGWALFGGEDQGPFDTFRRADEQMYKQKREHKEAGKIECK